MSLTSFHPTQKIRVPFSYSRLASRANANHNNANSRIVGRSSIIALRHIKNVISAIFTLAKQQDYFNGENPARDTAINPTAAVGSGRSYRSPGFSLEAEDCATHQHQRGRQGS